ncbi:hypothetical protein [Virgibacillus halodenitrificans]|uniref:hypothetical protein n=1 Tax=Virgibacillus halodenitrificans TaxID=1482 RepID=UPI000EF49F8A|nr:hypothetical protein [Virgibacillus halodenitrificans]
MKISNKKFEKLLAVAGISTSMILTGCTTENSKYVTIDGKSYKKAEEDGEEGFVNSHGTFIPFHSLSPNTKIKTGKSGIGSSVKPSGRGASS